VLVATNTRVAAARLVVEGVLAVSRTSDGENRLRGARQDLVDYDETFYKEEIVSGKPVVAKTEVERQFNANVVLWG